MKTNEVSKKLSYILRHDISIIKDINNEGYVDVDIILVRLGVIKSELDSLVATDNKKRYSYNADGTKIRANQGHSINVELSFKKIEEPIRLYHGTGSKSCKSIEKMV